MSHSKTSGRTHQSTCRLLASVPLDRGLCPRIGPDGVRTGEAVTARVVQLSRGALEAGALVRDPHGWMGLLVLGGMITVEIDCGRARTCWLVGEGDLLRPWELQRNSVTQGALWRVLNRSRVALLDTAFAEGAAATPEMVSAITSRATRTTYWLLAQSLTASLHPLEERLLLLFALLAERWGKVTPQGVRVELPLTHDQLARMCGARRQSVCSAMGRLRQGGLLEPSSHQGWLLRPDRRARTYGWSEDASWRHYAQAIGLRL